MSLRSTALGWRNSLVYYSFIQLHGVLYSFIQLPGVLLIHLTPWCITHSFNSVALLVYYSGVFIQVCLFRCVFSGWLFIQSSNSLSGVATTVPLYSEWSTVCVFIRASDVDLSHSLVCYSFIQVPVVWYSFIQLPCVFFIHSSNLEWLVYYSGVLFIHASLWYIISCIPLPVVLFMHPTQLSGVLFIHGTPSCSIHSSNSLGMTGVLFSSAWLAR